MVLPIVTPKLEPACTQEASSNWDLLAEPHIAGIQTKSSCRMFHKLFWSVWFSERIATCAGCEDGLHTETSLCVRDAIGRHAMEWALIIVRDQINGMEEMESTTVCGMDLGMTERCLSQFFTRANQHAV